MALNLNPKPFLKWAGGKSQLIKDIAPLYPFRSADIKKYAEPFVGGGAVLFDVLNKYDIKKAYISDINKELINCYISIRDKADDLIHILFDMENDYLHENKEKRLEYYNNIRQKFNFEKNGENKVLTSALLIFLNRTCFNGLYRVNKKGEFNVPMGSYKMPLICDRENINAVKTALQNVEIQHADYKKAEKFIDESCFVYIDPPYLPLSKSSNFTAYSEFEFLDKQQLELADFVKKMSKRGAKIVISNSDPKNSDENDNFFENAYKGLNIRRVDARRMINSNVEKRGKIKELLISNY